MDRTNPDARHAASLDDHTPAVVAPDGVVPDPAMPAPAVPEPDVPDFVVIVTVTRTGGIAGLRRAWRAEADGAGASTWIQLIEGCPWDAVAAGRFHEGADRFVWAVDARCGDDERRAELADADVRGPWRELIDAVREAGSPMPREHG